jgi:ribosomal peptide maturation radical SAM protein 1
VVEVVNGPSVRFVVVPFLPLSRPALGVSSLLAVLQQQHVSADVHYLNLAYAQQIGRGLYDYLTDYLPTQLLPGEAIFSRALWGDRALPFARYTEQVARAIEQIAIADQSGMTTIRALWERRAKESERAFEEAPRVIEQWADEVLAGSPRVLAFTSTFQQSAAALALAQEVRRRRPVERVAILFGGANCEDDMGRALADNFAFVDCVVSGEAEQVIGDLVASLLDGRSVPRFVEGAMVRDMDALPVPNFDGYFDAIARTASEDAINRCLVAESSRGCWWGAKSHCTFCGLNGGTMTFRAKTADRFASELESLSERYGLTVFALTDNILDMSYLRTLLPRLVAHAEPYKLFYETKSNLRKDQIEMLAAAGVTLLQPGIESFSTPILKLMGKGTTRLQNIQLLKWCAELGVSPVWNVLYGFPGEEPREYEEMIELLPALVHLPPPLGSTKVRLDRFGPYWKWPERHGLRNVRHWWSYDFVFANLPEAERGRLAYYFECDYADGREPRSYVRPVAELVNSWRDQPRGKMSLELRRSEGDAGGWVVVDTRPCRVDERVVLTPQALALIRILDGLRSRGSLVEAMQQHGVTVSEAEVDALLSQLRQRRFVVEENACWLSLIVDPEQRQRVAERQVALRLNRFGFQWPDDFPEPAQQQVVRVAMLGLRSSKSSPAPVA